MLHTTKGIVIHHFKYAEKSVIAKIYSQKHGLQSYILNRVRSKKSKNKAVYLQPLSLVEINGVHKEKSSLQQLKNIQLDLHKDFIDIVEKSRSTKLKKDSGIELFSGEFWSGRKAKELGLIDGIGNADQVLREKFGEDVVIKKFEKPKSWISKKLSGGSESQIETLIQLLEERSIWQKYGL